MNLLGFFHTEKPKKKFFEQPNNQKPKTKKLNKSHFQGFVNSQYFFMEISWIGPWISRIYWCQKIENWRSQKMSFISHGHFEFCTYVHVYQKVSSAIHTLLNPWSYKEWVSQISTNLMVKLQKHHKLNDSITGGATPSSKITEWAH